MLYKVKYFNPVKNSDVVNFIEAENPQKAKTTAYIMSLDEKSYGILDTNNFVVKEAALETDFTQEQAIEEVGQAVFDCCLKMFSEDVDKK